MIMNQQAKISISVLSKVFIVIVIGGILSSCAMIKAQKLEDTEQLLVLAGFKMKLADTPAKMAHLKTLTQQKIVAHQKDGKVYYIYADATNCQCFYWGQEQSYQHFLQLQDQQNIAQEERITTQVEEQQNLDWETMGYDMAGTGMGFN
jgi:hypothetical protein